MYGSFYLVKPCQSCRGLAWRAKALDLGFFQISENVSLRGDIAPSSETLPTLFPAHNITYESILAMSSWEGHRVVWADLGSHFHCRGYQIYLNFSCCVSLRSGGFLLPSNGRGFVLTAFVDLLRIWWKLWTLFECLCLRNFACVFRGFTDSRKSIRGLKLNPDACGWCEAGSDVVQSNKNVLDINKNRDSWKKLKLNLTLLVILI